eukprot:m.37730 g.37730  ORF g.37730 m.37730 type:complete len:61 (-) comp11129_c0_seq1:1098-1280(-)
MNAVREDQRHIGQDERSKAMRRSAQQSDTWSGVGPSKFTDPCLERRPAKNCASATMPEVS